MVSPLVSVILNAVMLIHYGMDWAVETENASLNVYPIPGSTTEVLVVVPDIDYIDTVFEDGSTIHRGINMADVITNLKNDHGLCFDYRNAVTTDIEIRRSADNRTVPARGVVHYDYIPWLPAMKVIHINDSGLGPGGQQFINGISAFNMTVPVVAC